MLSLAFTLVQSLQHTSSANGFLGTIDFLSSSLRSANRFSLESQAAKMRSEGSPRVGLQFLNNIMGQQPHNMRRLVHANASRFSISRRKQQRCQKLWLRSEERNIATEHDNTGASPVTVSSCQQRSLNVSDGNSAANTLHIAPQNYTILPKRVAVVDLELEDLLDFLRQYEGACSRLQMVCPYSGYPLPSITIQIDESPSVKVDLSLRMCERLCTKLLAKSVETTKGRMSE